MKKRGPLSTPETMRPPASPRLKPSSPVCPGAGFVGGLVGGVSGSFMVPAVDTFIEEPFSVLALWALMTWQHKSGGAGNLPTALLAGTSDHYARAHRGDKPRLGLLFSFSVAGLA